MWLQKNLQSEVCEVRGRVHALQQELDNSEKVQQDFVRLSQSLQVRASLVFFLNTELKDRSPTIFGYWQVVCLIFYFSALGFKVL